MQAYSCYLEALRIQPNFAIAWSNLAGLFMESGDLNRALQYYKVASFQFLMNSTRLTCLFEFPCFTDNTWSISYLHQIHICWLFTSCFVIHKLLLNLELMLCDLFVLSQEAVKLKPAFPDAYLNLGNVYKVSCHA